MSSHSSLPVVEPVSVGASKNQKERISWAIKHRQVFQEVNSEVASIVPNKVAVDDEDQDIAYYQRQYDRKVEKKMYELSKKQTDGEKKKKDGMARLRHMSPSSADKLKRVAQFVKSIRTIPSTFKPTPKVSPALFNKTVAPTKCPIAHAEIDDSESETEGPAPKRAKTSCGAILKNGCDHCTTTGKKCSFVTDEKTLHPSRSTDTSPSLVDPLIAKLDIIIDLLRANRDSTDKAVEFVDLRQWL